MLPMSVLGWLHHIYVVYSSVFCWSQRQHGSPTKDRARCSFRHGLSRVVTRRCRSFHLFMIDVFSSPNLWKCFVNKPKTLTVRQHPESCDLTSSYPVSVEDRVAYLNARWRGSPTQEVGSWHFLARLIARAKPDKKFILREARRRLVFMSLVNRHQAFLTPPKTVSSVPETPPR